MTNVNSIRSQLLRLLLGPMVLVLAIGGAIDYNVAFRPASIAYDSTVLKTATALSNLIEESHAGGAHLNIPPIAERILQSDQYDQVFYLVLNDRKDVLAGHADLPQPSTWTSKPQLFDAIYRNEPVRTAALQVARGGQPFRILVAETMGKRRRIVWEVVMGMLAPELLVAGILVALVWYSIRRGLEPLDELRGELLARDTSDLMPMCGTRYPSELQPVVDALNRLLERLQLTLSAQQRFIADAAHQLRTPLAGLQTLAAVAARQPSLDQCRASIAKLQVATMRANHLANQLLTLARADPGSKDQRDFSRMDLAELISGNVDLWVPRAISRQIDLGFDLTPAVVTGSMLLLRELTSNLIDNSLHYTPAGGHVTVRTKTEGRTAILEVEDDGPGIPISERDSVLQRFYRIAGTPGDGCGLGLAIVHEIAEAHSASLSIDTGMGDVGTCVRLSFPLAREGQEPSKSGENENARIQ